MLIARYRHKYNTHPINTHKSNHEITKTKKKIFLETFLVLKHINKFEIKVVLRSKQLP